MAAIRGDHGAVVEWWLLLVTLGCWWRPVLEGDNGLVVVGRAKVFFYVLGLALLVQACPNGCFLGW